MLSDLANNPPCPTSLCGILSDVTGNTLCRTRYRTLSWAVCRDCRDWEGRYLPFSIIGLDTALAYGILHCRPMDTESTVLSDVNLGALKGLAHVYLSGGSARVPVVWRS